MPARAPTRRPRLLPTALAAAALVGLTAGGVLTATGSAAEPAADTCGAGRVYVTVQPVVDTTDWKPARKAGPPLAGCVDSDALDQAAKPTPTNPRG